MSNNLNNPPHKPITALETNGANNPNQSSDFSDSSDNSSTNNKAIIQNDSSRNTLTAQPANPNINRGYTRKGTLNKNTSTKGSVTMLQEEEKKKNWKRKIGKFIDSTPVLIIMSIFTVFVLIITDLQAAFLRKNVDYGLNVIQCILLGIFAIEIVLACIGKPDYPLSFFFWLDLIATVSMIQDIDWIMEPIMGYEPHDPTLTQKAASETIGKQAAVKAMNKVNSATRATRVLRIIRIVRLIRMVKLYKSVVIAREQKEKKKMEEIKNMLKNEREFSDMSNSSRERSSDGSLRHTTATSLNIKDRSEFHHNINSEYMNINSHNQSQSESNHNNNEYVHEMKLSDPNKQITSNDNNNNKQIQTTSPQQNEDTNIQIKVKKAMSIKRQSSQKLQTQKLNTKLTLTPVEDDDDEDIEELINESRISKIITESLTKKVIILILGLLIIFPFLSDDFYIDNRSISYSQLAEYLTNDEILYGVYSYIIPKDTLDIFFDKQFPAINITIGKQLYYTNPEFTDVNYFRYSEISSEYSEDGTVCVVYSILKETQLEGILNMVQTVFVCVCLALATILFENDANKLVLTPLEIMTEIVEMVAKDPINAKNVDTLQTGIKAEMIEEEEGEHSNNKNNKSGQHNNNKDNDNYEIQVIKTAIIKISALLVIGFGEAGCNIITKNLASGSDLNPRLKGKKKTAIFGFCDIRQFDLINIALEERISLFVNTIAEIVHSSVDRFGGSTNKNIGDAFLNVWKFYNETPIKKTNLLSTKKQTIQRKDNLIEIDPSNIQVSITADSSILSFLRILMKINKSYSLLSYRENPEIIKHIPNFKLNMGFGLHFGYGIEGAIGSTYKIDASYLSPNVNIAARLESATRQFGVNLLISGPLYDKCSDDMKQLCRYVDCVMVKGSEQPLDLYTIDVNLDLKLSDEKKVNYAHHKEKRQRYADKKELFKKEIDYARSVTKVVLAKASFMELLKTKRNDNFYLAWNSGIDNYKEGKFKKAAEYFKQCLAIEPNDGPAKTLIKFFEKVNYVTPQGWKGVRELTSK